MKRSNSLEKLWKRHKGKCHYCKRRLTKELGRGLTATKDHIYAAGNDYVHRLLRPKIKGTKSLVLACRRCNSWRGNMPYEQFKALVESKLSLGEPLPGGE